MDFTESLRPNGMVIYNTTLIDTGTDRVDVKKFGVPATEIAEHLKQEVPPDQMRDPKMLTNAVMFGAFLELCAPQISDELIKDSLKHLLAGKREGLIELNYLALSKGRQFVRTNPLPDHVTISPFHCIPSWAVQ